MSCAKIGGAPTDVTAIPEIVTGARRSFATGKYLKTFVDRKHHLDCLKRMVQENTKALGDALWEDLHRHRSFSAKILGGCVRSIDLAKSQMETWASTVTRPQVGSNRCEVRYQPRGVVLIIGTWNFPCPLVIKPLASAIAAGNTVVVKLSEVCERVSALLAKLLTSYMDEAVVRVVQGAIPQATALLRERFDLIFYTGNKTVGRVVMSAAAKHLTPCVLELGGKNPVIVAKDANLDVAARKIVDGRFKNAGQFCVAPDYVLCDASVLRKFLEAAKRAIVTFFGRNPKMSSSFGRIVNERHCQRLAALLHDPKRGGDVFVGGEVDVKDRYCAPTIVVDPKHNSKLMEDEIFGPILPILSVSNVDEALEIVNTRSSPLALYVFSASSSTCDRVVRSTHSGGACVNDVIVHMLNEVLPFGGFGESGMGSYHGEYGFRAFSHERAVMLVSPTHEDRSRYPPFSKA